MRNKVLYMLVLLCLGFIPRADAQPQLMKLVGNPNNVNNPYHVKAISTKATTGGGHIHAGVYWDQITAGYMGHKIYLLKTDNAGATTWMKVYDIPETTVEDPGEVIQTSDGGYAVVGQALNLNLTNNSFDMDVFVFKTNSTGTVTLYNRYGSGNSHETGYSIRELASPDQNKFVITGAVYPQGRITSIFNIYNETPGIFEPHVNSEMKHVLVMKIDGTAAVPGSVSWSKMYEPIDNNIWKESEGYKILELGSKDLILTGMYSSGYLVYPPNGYVAHVYPIVYHLTSAGNVNWSKVYHEATGANKTLHDASGISMVDLGSSGFAVTGSESHQDNISGNSYEGMMLFRTGTTGNVTWSRHLQGSSTQVSSSSDDILFHNNNLHIVGYRYVSNPPHGPGSGKHLYLRSDLSGSKLSAYEYTQKGGIYGGKNVVKNAAIDMGSTGGYVHTACILGERASGLGDMTYISTDMNAQTGSTSCENTNTESFNDLQLDDFNISLNVTSNVIQIFATTQPLAVTNLTPDEETICQEATASKFRDANFNGIWDVGEIFIPGWPIIITADNNPPVVIYTGGTGQVVVPLGTLPVTIKELNLPWYIPIYPSTGSYVYTGGPIPVGGFRFANYECPNRCENIHDMVAYLHMEETALAAGSAVCNLVNTDGVITAGTSPVSVTGPSGNLNAIQFSPGPEISIPHYPEMDFGFGSFSADGYIKLTSLGTKQVIVSQMGTSGSNLKGWSFYATSDRLGFERQNGFGGSYTWNPAGPAWFTLNTWHHVAFVFDGPANTMTFYVDGVARTSMGYGTWWVYDHNNLAPMLIGENFNGGIDEISVYNRALTATEIADIYANNKCREYIKITPLSGGCIPSQVNATYDVTVYNGDVNTNSFKYAFSGLPAGGGCTVNGPRTFNPDNGTFSLAGCGTNTTFNVSIPCNATHNPGNIGCFAVTVWNQTAGRCALDRSQGISLNQYKPSPPKQNNAMNASSSILNDGTGERIVTGNDASTDATYISVNPNPFKDNIMLKVVMTKEDYVSISVSDVLGREILPPRVYLLGEGEHALQLDAAQLSNGMYILNATIGSREIHTRVLKQD